MRSSRTDGGAYGNRVAFLLAGAVKEADDMLPAPSRMVLLADDDVSGFDKGPLEVVIALLDHSAIVGLTAAGLHLGHSAGVACEMLGARAPTLRYGMLRENGQSNPVRGR